MAPLADASNPSAGPLTACIFLARCFFHGMRITAGSAARSSLTVRDIIAWAEFCVTAVASGACQLLPWEAYAHGAYLTLLDGLGLGLGMTETEALELRQACTDFVRAQLPVEARHALDAAAFIELPKGLGLIENTSTMDDALFGVTPFFISKVRACPLCALRQSFGSGCVGQRVDDTNEMSSF